MFLIFFLYMSKISWFSPWFIKHHCSFLRIFVHDLVSTCHFLGIDLMPHSFGYFLLQSHYILKLLIKFRMEDCKPVFTPCSILLSSCSSSSPLILLYIRVSSVVFNTSCLLSLTSYSSLIGPINKCTIMYLRNRRSSNISSTTLRALSFIAFSSIRAMTYVLVHLGI